MKTICKEEPCAEYDEQLRLIAAFDSLLTDICNEYMDVNDDGSFKGGFLAERANMLLRICGPSIDSITQAKISAIRDSMGEIQKEIDALQRHNLVDHATGAKGCLVAVEKLLLTL